MKLLILGAGGHGRVCKETAEQMINDVGEKLYDEVDFLDDSSPMAIGKLNDIEGMREAYDNVFVALGASEMRKKWTEHAEMLGYHVVTLAHRNAYIASDVEVGCGSVIMPKVILQSGVQVKRGCIISAGAIVDHDAVVEEYSHINAGAVVASLSRVPAGTKVDYQSVWK